MLMPDPFSPLGTTTSVFISIADTPSVDLSSTVSAQYLNQGFNNGVSNTIPKTDEEYMVEINNAIVNQAATDMSILTPTLIGSSSFSANGLTYKVASTNGILTVYNQPNTNTIKPVIFDTFDQADYNNRYTSLDSPIRYDDARDIAFFRIVTNDNKFTTIFPNFNAYTLPGITKDKFKQFILLSLQEASQERMQLVETSSDFQLLFFGKKPEFLQLSGVIKNTTDNPWNINMTFMWDELMRGSKLVENGWILQIYADGQLYFGYPFNFQRSKVAPNDFTVNFNMSFVITNRVNLYGTNLMQNQAYFAGKV